MDVGFVRGGFEQWRRYYDDTGGYYRPFSIPAFNLDRDLYLNIGRAWIEFGLTVPDLPQVVVGYEYQFKEGVKSMLERGSVGDKKIFPAAKNIDEHVHVVKVDATHDISGWRIEDNARIELYTQRTREDNAASFTLGPGPDVLTRTDQEAMHVQGMN